MTAMLGANGGVWRSRWRHIGMMELNGKGVQGSEMAWKSDAVVRDGVEGGNSDGDCHGRE